METEEQNNCDKNVEECYKKAFSQLEKDGKITLESLSQIEFQNIENREIERLFEESSINKDGHMDEHEFYTFMQKIAVKQHNSSENDDSPAVFNFMEKESVEKNEAEEKPHPSDNLEKEGDDADLKESSVEEPSDSQVEIDPENQKEETADKEPNISEEKKRAAEIIISTWKEMKKVSEAKAERARLKKEKEDLKKENESSSKEEDIKKEDTCDLDDSDAIDNNDMKTEDATNSTNQNEGDNEQNKKKTEDRKKSKDRELENEKSESEHAEAEAQSSDMSKSSSEESSEEAPAMDEATELHEEKKESEEKKSENEEEAAQCADQAESTEAESKVTEDNQTEEINETSNEASNEALNDTANETSNETSNEVSNEISNDASDKNNLEELSNILASTLEQIAYLKQSQAENNAEFRTTSLLFAAVQLCCEGGRIALTEEEVEERAELIVRAFGEKETKRNEKRKREEEGDGEGEGEELEVMEVVENTEKEEADAEETKCEDKTNELGSSQMQMLKKRLNATSSEETTELSGEETTDLLGAPLFELKKDLLKRTLTPFFSKHILSLCHNFLVEKAKQVLSDEQLPFSVSQAINKQKKRKANSLSSTSRNLSSSKRLANSRTGYLSSTQVEPGYSRKNSRDSLSSTLPASANSSSSSMLSASSFNPNLSQTVQSPNSSYYSSRPSPNNRRSAMQSSPKDASMRPISSTPSSRLKSSTASLNATSTSLAATSSSSSSSSPSSSSSVSQPAYVHYDRLSFTRFHFRFLKMMRQLRIDDWEDCQLYSVSASAAPSTASSSLRISPISTRSSSVSSPNYNASSATFAASPYQTVSPSAASEVSRCSSVRSMNSVHEERISGEWEGEEMMAEKEDDYDCGRGIDPEADECMFERQIQMERKKRLERKRAEENQKDLFDWEESKKLAPPSNAVCLPTMVRRVERPSSKK
ncbi:uncharacterized protein MONOS_1548 [Monocercomonoides exilis]|uniref:uncharacterized protein n=1 Tax=Monocercomonoides exilis TaxID=2049356 RepID=UPI003559541B|nr:hypothetical protein MONOS_1548 [Monocercomonoides exilis]|eukprot:MONOS_1548.1-p1 / transcript=MONOS_1548.1 / gene=MONOS_1548 / organism=Monocercomonoides_exilis_PA203 / gene_product=unspecified product / transcript_product=unspecified product / location=Mono_scaffold00027:207447-210482(+) / protein_length=938 / sequence_SO=supercontig / SO=protein_coding / is_pseudo=false